MQPGRTSRDLEPTLRLQAGLFGLCLVSASTWLGACSSSKAPQPVAASPAGATGAGGEGGAGGQSQSLPAVPEAPRAGSLAAVGGAGAGGAPARAGTGAAGRAGVGGKLAAAGGGSGQPAGGSAGKAADPGTVELPPLNAGLDYQLGGGYAPADSVKIVSRDRKDKPAAGLYNICYVNGFQAQQEENDFWLKDHPDLVLRDQAGKPVIDQDWNEMLFDVSTAAKRDALAQVMGEWIAGCAQAGFAAVEVDNLDSYSRSGGRLKEDDAVTFVRLLADSAHAHGLAIAQKNASELVGRRKEMGTDFVVAEECNRYSECDDYRAGYEDHVLVIEYRRSDFQTGCGKYPQLSIVLRDVDLVKPGDSAYVFDGC